MKEWIEEFIPTVLPMGYRYHGIIGEVRYWECIGVVGYFSVGMSGVVENNKRWIHLSVAQKNKLPSWSLLRDVKNIFIGRERSAIQILPKESEYVNLHNYCLHLFCCIDDDNIIPDFNDDQGSL